MSTHVAKGGQEPERGAAHGTEETGGRADQQAISEFAYLTEPIYELLEVMWTVVSLYEQHFHNGGSLATEEDKRVRESLGIYAKLLDNCTEEEVLKLHRELYLDLFEDHRFEFVGVPRKLKEFLSSLSFEGKSNLKLRIEQVNVPTLEFGSNIRQPTGTFIPLGPVYRMAVRLREMHKKRFVQGGQWQHSDPEANSMHRICLLVLQLLEPTMQGKDLRDCQNVMAYYKNKRVLALPEEEQSPFDQVKDVLSKIDLSGLARSFGMPDDPNLNPNELINDLLSDEKGLADMIAGGNIDEAVNRLGSRMRHHLHDHTGPERVGANYWGDEEGEDDGEPVEYLEPIDDELD